MKNKKRIPVYFLGLVICRMIVFPSILSGSEATGYMIKAWMIEDGLPQNSILSMVQARNGYIWLGTQLGLVRFDGIRFSVFNQWNTPALKNNRIKALYEDSDGTLWIGTKGGGITAKKNRTWTNFQTGNGLWSNHIQTIWQDRSGIIWIGTEKGLNSFENNEIKKFQTADMGIIHAIRADREENLLIGSEKGLFLKRKISSRGKGYFEKLFDQPVFCIFPEPSGNIWLGTGKGIRIIRDDKVMALDSQEKSLMNLSITVLGRDKKGNLWIGTDGKGVLLFKDRLIHHFLTSNGLTDNFIYSLIGDQESNIWIGTQTGGVIRLKPRFISPISQEDGIPENAVTAVIQDTKGFLWIGTRHQGVVKYKDKEVFATFSKNNGLSSNRINALTQTRTGTLWVGTEDGGINRIENNRVFSYTKKQGLLSNTVTAIYQDSSGILWIGTPNGLNQYINDTIQSKESFRGYSIRTLFQDRRGTLWIGSHRGLSQIKPDIVRHLKISGDASEYEVLAIYESPTEPGTLWIGTNGMGLIRIEGDSITHYTEKNGLESNYVFSLTETGKGEERYLWISSITGISRISFESLNRFCQKETDFITPALFNESDGMISSECISSVQPSVWKTKEENIFIPTVKGIAVVNPGNLPEKINPVPVIIEDFIIDDESYIHKNQPYIPAGKQMYEFYFTALDYSSPRNIKFRYQLEGFEDKWNLLDYRQKRSVLYFNLRPGKYSFKITASNHLGEWNKKHEQFPFHIRSDLKETLLVYIPRVLILLVVSAGFLMWRLRKKKPTVRMKKYQTSALTEDRADEILQKLLAIMEEENLFLDPNLTLKKISEKIMVHPNHISQIVNEKLDQSYNDFINHYRIDRAKEKLLDPVGNEKNILEIAYDVGFYSKSVFNTAFKKFTGMTPSEYKQKFTKP